MGWGETVDLAAMAESYAEPVVLYYRRNVVTTTLSLRTVALIALFMGCGGILAFLVRLSLQGIAHLFLHLAGL